MEPIQLNSNAERVSFVIHQSLMMFNGQRLYFDPNNVTNYDEQSVLLFMQHKYFNNYTDFEKLRLCTNLIDLDMHEAFENFVERCDHINFSDPIMATPLVYATQKNKIDFVKTAIQNGANMNYQDMFVISAFSTAHERNNLAVGKVLLEYGVHMGYLELREFRPDFRDMVTFHLLKLKALGRLDRTYVLWLGARMNPRFEQFGENCKTEVGQMKTIKISPDCPVTFYEFLTTDVNSMTKYLMNERTRNDFLEFDLGSVFPIYSSMIRLRQETCLNKIAFRNKGFVILRKILFQTRVIPDDVVHKIYEFFDERDVKYFLREYNFCTECMLLGF